MAEGVIGTKANVTADSTQSVTLLAENAARKKWSVFNDSTAILYLDETGGTASSTSHTVQVPAGYYYEPPGGEYVSITKITGRWSATNGSARVAEYV